MKKYILPFISVCFIVLSLFVLKNLFLTGLKSDPAAEQIMNETVTEEKKEETDQEKKEETKEEEKEETVTENSSQAVSADLQEAGQQRYRMLDFDRRLILGVGEQDQYVCSIFTLAYARAILDSDYKSDPYDYYDGDGAVWRWAGYEDIAGNDSLEKVLKKAYDEITKGRPVIFFVSDVYAYTAGEVKESRQSGDHYVLLIGYKENADSSNLKPSDFYAADPTSGYRGSKDADIPWVDLTDEAPGLVSGEYALYAPTDPDKHVSTCIAYADTSEWDADLTNEIRPNYINSPQ